MKIGNGFGFKVVQTVFYTLIVVLFLALGVFFTVRSTDFVGLVFTSNTSSYIDGYYSDGEFVDFDNDTVNGHSVDGSIVRRDDQLILEIKAYDNELEKYVTSTYNYDKSDNSARRLYFTNGTQTLEVSYYDVGYNYEWDYTFTMSIVFLVIGGVFAVVDILHLIATLKGRKSRGANVLGIVVNLPFALGAVGLCGLIGCVKGRMYLQFTQSGYGAGAPVQPVQPEPVQPVSERHAEAVQMGIDTEEQTSEKVGADNVSAEDNAGKTYIKKSDFKLDLYDASVDEKTWKDFKRSASQEELAVIAIGAKYRVSHSRIYNILFAVGIILSIALFWPTGGYSLIAYPVFAFLATKSIRYEDTLSQAYRKLDKEYKAFVDGYFNCGIGWTILDIFIKLGTFWLTIPYQAILLFIGLFAPNFVISKNGILVSIPKGYDVGNLGAVGAYYEGFKFIDEALESQSKSSPKTEQTGSSADDYYKRDEYTYTDSHGYQQSVYSSDGKEFYDAGGHYVGSSSEYGGKFKKKD